MFKRILAIATMVCALPALANATKTDVTIWAQSAGGIITVTNALPNPVKLTSAYGQVFGSYSTAGGVAPNVTVTPNPGYSVSGTTTCTGSIASGYDPSTVTCAEGQSVQALFAYVPQAAVVTASAGVGGHVNMTKLSNIFVGQKFVSAVTFKFTPLAGYSVTGITGIPAGAIVNPLGADTAGGAVNQVVSVILPAGYTLTNVPVNLAAGFGTTQAVANAGAPQTIVAPASTATLNGSASLNAVSYSWTQTSGPVAATLATPTAASCAVSNMTALGTYIFKLTVNGSVYKTTSVTVSNSIAAAAATECVNCHDANGIGGGLAAGGIYANYTSSIHGQNTHSLCAMCHVGTNAAGHPGTVTKNSVDPSTFTDKAAGVNGTQTAGQIFCTGCHNGSHPIPHLYPGDTKGTTSANFHVTCAACHTDATGKTAGTGDAHSIQGLPGCINCHSVAQKNVADGLVNDNNGVRAITTEFGKWSHHVTGTTLQDAHCAACHLEGKASNGAIVVDGTYHMVDNKTHLRNAATDADMQWNPAAPNHSTMDAFCMSCHSATGATSTQSAAIQAIIVPAPGKTASATNPFGDTISNQYDKLQRPAVVNVNDQFNATNNSHHAVKGPRYSGRTRLAGPRQIASPATFTQNSSATLPGARNTIYDAGKFNQLYAPLADNGGEAAPRTGSATLGDDSTLHCGDCHTVGQWKPGVATNALGALNTVAIGAHGSNNEYLLRNAAGTDQHHVPQQYNGGKTTATLTSLATGQNFSVASGKYLYEPGAQYLVCYNCHQINNYGNGNSHISEQTTETNCNSSINTFGNYTATGAQRLANRATIATFNMTTANTNSNIFGIQCANCHNNGISAGNIFGGIHGSADQTYLDGAGNTTKHERFLPGLGNVMYAPGTRGGFTGGTTAYQSYSSAVQKSGISTGQRFKGSYPYTTGGVTNDTNWEEKSRIPVGDGVTNWSHNPGAAGCYTISAPDDTMEPYSAEGNGVPAGPPASLGLTDPKGNALYGNWGGCADHSQQTGSSVRQPRSGDTSIRPVTY